jgi:hypothetical protein
MALSRPSAVTSCASLTFGENGSSINVKCPCGYESSLARGLKGFRVLDERRGSSLLLVCSLCGASLVADLTASSVPIMSAADCSALIQLSA